MKLRSQDDGKLISEVGRKHIGYTLLNGVAFLADLAAQLTCNYFLLVLLEDLQTEVSFAERASQYVKKITFHDLGVCHHEKYKSLDRLPAVFPTPGYGWVVNLSRGIRPLVRIRPTKSEGLKV